MAKARELVTECGIIDPTTLFNQVQHLAEDDEEAYGAVGLALEEAPDAAADSEPTYDAKTEREIVSYFAAFDEDDRKAALRRVNDGLKIKLPIEETDPPPFKVRSAAAMKADPPTEEPGLWGHHLHTGEMTSICARGGLGKTAVTRNAMLHGAAGAASWEWILSAH